MRKKLSERQGITLIALVITIIVLLILAGVSIAMLTGENGILTQANNAKLQTEYSDVTEAMSLAVSEYTLEKQTNTETAQKSFVDWLKDKGYINASNEIQTAILLGKELSTGKGSGTTDVYKLEEVTETAKLASNIQVTATEEEKKYEIVYYDKKGTREVLKTFSMNENDNQEVDTSMFDITDNGTISIKDYDSYYEKEKEWTVENLIIPSRINGIEVKIIPDNFMAYIDIAGVTKNIYIPNTVVSIGQYAFCGCNGIESIEIPASVQYMKYAFPLCQNLETIEVNFEEGNTPAGWEENWYPSNVTVEYLTPYLNFAKEYLSNKDRGELEELLLKTERYIGTFEEYLSEAQISREEIEKMAQDEGKTYEEFLRETLEKDSWVEVEYYISLKGWNNKTTSELEQIVLEQMGIEGTFDNFLGEQGKTREDFEEMYKGEGFRSEDDFLKYGLYQMK